MIVRVGVISAIDEGTGMVSVTYPQYDDSTTDYIPVLSYCDEYKKMTIDDEVLVLHLPGNESEAFVVGKYWNEDNTPVNVSNADFRKEFGQTEEEAYVDFTANVLTIKAPEIIFENESGSISLTELINLRNEVSNE